MKPKTVTQPVRQLHEIAEEIRVAWFEEAHVTGCTTKAGIPVKYAYAIPYLHAMGTLREINQMYGLDSGYSIVRHFLANAGTWRGETARRIKAELKAMAGVK